MKTCIHKGAIALGLMVCSSIVQAQSMNPTRIKEYVVKPVNTFDIALTNHYPEKMCYDIEENNKQSLIPSVCLAPMGRKVFKVITLTKPDEYGNHSFCTVARVKGNLRVRMCSTIKTYYPASSLGQ